MPFSPVIAGSAALLLTIQVRPIRRLVPRPWVADTVLFALLAWQSITAVMRVDARGLWQLAALIVAPLSPAVETGAQVVGALAVFAVVIVLAEVVRRLALRQTRTVGELLERLSLDSSTAAKPDPPRRRGRPASTQSRGAISG